MQRPRLTHVVETLPASVPFVGPETLERRSGIPFLARLGANEIGFGPSPKVIAAIRDAAPHVWTYGDPENFDLQQALAAHLGIAADNIMVGEGIDGLLGLTCRLFLESGDRVVTSLGAYPTFNYHVKAMGAELITVPYEHDRESLNGLSAAAVEASTRIVYLANPDNPMGTWWRAGDIEAFIASIPDKTLIVLDEAYGETAPMGTLPPLDVTRPNLLRFRTFSKAYGLAGLRVGYVIGEQETIAAFNRIRNHFGVNKIAQIAALAALNDQFYLQDVVARVISARERISDLARNLGWLPLASATNFVAIDCCKDGAHAQAILDKLANRGVFIRKPTVPGLDRSIRVSVGTPDEITLLERELTEIVREV